MSVLQKIKKLNVELLAPEGAVFVGNNDAGMPVYKRTIVRAGPHEAMKDDKGNEVWVKHPTTGEPLYRRWRRKRMEITHFIIPNQQGNGNLSWDIYQPPTAEELSRMAQDREIEKLKDALPRLMVEKGITVESFLTALEAASGRASEAPIPEPAAVPEIPEMPNDEAASAIQPIGGGYYLLSDGKTKVQGREKAIAAEAELRNPVGAEG